MSLRPYHETGDKYRTTRTLRVEEATQTERFVTETEEVTLTEVLQVDDSGRLMAVRRAWELSATRLTKGFGEGELASGDLDGCTLELRQRAGGVDASVLVGDADVRGRTFLIEGFDVGLLPLDAVRENDYWELRGSRLDGLNRFVTAMGFEIEKNGLTCQLARVTDELAVIDVDWRITGRFGETPAVLEFRGELQFDRENRIISRFEITGGRQSDRGSGQQVEIRIIRRPVEGWLDLER